MGRSLNQLGYIASQCSNVAAEHSLWPVRPADMLSGGGFGRFQTCWAHRHDAYVPLRATDFRTKYNAEASASTIAVTINSRAVACARIQMIAMIASAGTIFIPGKLNGSPSDRTSRCTRIQQPAQQSRYINNTATFESTASCSKVPLSDSAKAIVA